MIATLREYAKHKDGTYVSLEMSKESKQLLDNFVRMNLGLEERVDSDTYHTTIIYSRTPVPDAENIPNKSSLPVEAIPVAYEVFPTKNDGRCLVMRIQCPFATNVNAWLNTKGATSDYDTYKPHITLAYDIQQEVDIKDLPIPTFTLVFDRLNVAPLETDYVPKNAE